MEATAPPRQVTDNKRATIAKKQERITFMTFSAARLFKFCPARLQHQMNSNVRLPCGVSPGLTSCSNRLVNANRTMTE